MTSPMAFIMSPRSLSIRAAAFGSDMSIWPPIMPRPPAMLWPPIIPCPPIMPPIIGHIIMPWPPIMLPIIGCWDCGWCCWAAGDCGFAGACPWVWAGGVIGFIWASAAATVARSARTVAAIVIWLMSITLRDLALAILSSAPPVQRSTSPAYPRATESAPLRETRLPLWLRPPRGGRSLDLAGQRRHRHGLRRRPRREHTRLRHRPPGLVRDQVGQRGPAHAPLAAPHADARPGLHLVDVGGPLAPGQE